MMDIIHNEPIKDNRGQLIPFEIEKEICFPIKRIFFLSNMPIGSVRGNHANMKGESLVILISGKIKVTLIDSCKKEFYLEKEGDYLNIPIATWIIIENMDLQTVVCVCSSNSYSVEDYDSDFNHFRRISHVRH